jgi:hypothetical protein
MHVKAQNAKVKKDINYNIKIEKSKNIDSIMKVGHILYTYYVHTNDEMTNNIQLQCIMENYKNTLFTNICILVDSEDIQKNVSEKFNLELGNDCSEKIRYILNKNNVLQIFNLKEKLDTEFINELLNYANEVVDNSELRVIKNTSIYLHISPGITFPFLILSVAYICLFDPDVVLLKVSFTESSVSGELLLVLAQSKTARSV